MNEATPHLPNDSPSFHPVHSLIRAVGPTVLHHAKGRARSGDGRLFSSYDTPEHGKLWIITDDIRGEGEGPLTTVMFPEDY